VRPAHEALGDGVRALQDRMKARLIAFSITAALLAGGWLTYQRDLARELARVSTGSRIADTRCGPIEFAEMGSGPAVLLVHGAGGGFDQALGFVEHFSRAGFHAIAMSRFGYLRTPLPADASPAAQADAHACLLDALGVERAAVVGVSAGAPSTIQFALRHPGRTDAMVLLVPLAYAPRAPSAGPSPMALFMLEQATRSDLLYWAALRAAPSLVVRTILATPPEVLAGASAHEQARVRELMALRARAHFHADAGDQPGRRPVRHARKRALHRAARSRRAARRLSERRPRLGGAPRRASRADRCVPRQAGGAAGGIEPLSLSFTQRRKPA